MSPPSSRGGAAQSTTPPSNATIFATNLPPPRFFKGLANLSDVIKDFTPASYALHSPLPHYD